MIRQAVDSSAFKDSRRMTRTSSATTQHHIHSSGRIRMMPLLSACILCWYAILLLVPLVVDSFLLRPQPPSRITTRHILLSSPAKLLLVANDDNSHPSSASSSESSFTSSNNHPKYNVSLLLIDHYDSFTYNLHDMLAQLTVEPPTVVAKDFAFENSSSFLNQFDGVVLSPGPGTPHEQPTMEAIIPSKPLLGVCLGHQLLALKYGAKVGRTPSGPVHGQDHWISTTSGVGGDGNDNLLLQNNSTNATTLDDDASLSSPPSKPLRYPSLFQGLPSSFRVVRYHSLCAYDLPKDDGSLVVTATSRDDHVIQAMQHSHHPHYGVQFHPESIGTQCGLGLLENFCKVVQECKDSDDAAVVTADHHSSTVDTNTFKTVSSIDNLLGRKNRPSVPLPQVESAPLASPPTKQPRFRVVMHRIQSSIQPLQVFERYYARETHSVWLDSSSSYQSGGRGEIDIFAAPARPDDILEYHQGFDQTDILTTLETQLYGSNHEYGHTSTIGWYNASSSKQALDASLLEWIDESEPASQTQLPPFHYRGGFLGFLGYEVRHDTQRYLKHQEGGQVSAAAAARSTNDDEASDHRQGTPTAAFFLARQSMVFHHPTQSWYLIGLAEDDKDVDDNQDWMNSIIENLNSWEEQNDNAPNASVETHDDEPTPPPFIGNRPRDVYLKDIEKCHEFIRQGESYELCLTNQLEARVFDAKRSSFDLYKGLRCSNPAPYSSYFRWNVESKRESETTWSDEPNPSSLVLCSSSPERFMSLSWMRPHPEVPSFLQAEAKPIKGTAARVIPQDGMCRTDAESREDERRARSLELSLKDRAENLMIVDLLRNDLSRVCRVGTVHVPKLMDIESFETVHQMVSTIRGSISDTKTSIDLLRASFPGGSMTGAPKIRTMELLEELEQGVERGPYSGSLGYISVNGCMDMNIIIRTAVLTLDDENENAWKVSVGAGGAITALSDVEDEYNEMELKASAVVKAVQEWASRPRRGEIMEGQSVQNATGIVQ